MKSRFCLTILAICALPVALAGNLLGDAAISAGSHAAAISAGSHAGGLNPGIGGPPPCPAGTTARLEIVNNCEDPAFAVFSPGGSPGQPQALKNSGGWFELTQHQKIMGVENIISIPGHKAWVRLIAQP